MTDKELELNQQILQLMETVQDLQEQIATTRRSNKILRLSNRSLREQLNIRHLTDELFKELCQPDLPRIEIDVTPTEGGLPSEGSS